MAAVVVAQDAAPTIPPISQASLTPDQAVEKALTLNPLIRLAEEHIRYAKSRIQFAGVRPNPNLDVSFRSDVIGDQNSEHQLEMHISQAFPMTARLRNARVLRQVEVDLAQAELADAKHAIANEVRAAVIEHAIQVRQQTLLGIQREINRKLLSFLEMQSDTGEISMLDINEAKLKGKQLEREERVLQLSLLKSLAQLKRRIGVSPQAALQVGMDLTLPAELRLAASADGAAPDHPQLKLARSRIAAAKAGVELERSMKYEDLTLGVILGQDKAVDDPGGLDRNTFLGLGLSIPLPLRRANQDQLAKAKHSVRKAEGELASLEKQLTHVRAIARLELQNALQLAEETNGDVIDLAEQNLKDVREAYAIGLATFIQVQRAQEMLVGFRRAALSAAADYHRAESVVRHPIRYKGAL